MSHMTKLKANIILHVTYISVPIKAILARQPLCEEINSKHLTDPMIFMKRIIVDMGTRMYVGEQLQGTFNSRHYRSHLCQSCHL